MKECGPKPGLLRGELFDQDFSHPGSGPSWEVRIRPAGINPEFEERFEETDPDVLTAEQEGY